ncbi:MAG: hypothetical protein GX455_14555, partial [Phycisphaerae bacterium]|nr:hypothetical protein [Phycisphaerae bacterium]
MQARGSISAIITLGPPWADLRFDNLGEYNTVGSFAWVNVFGNYIDEVLVRAGNYDTYYYAHNHLYSPVAVMDFTAGTVLER